MTPSASREMGTVPISGGNGATKRGLSPFLAAQKRGLSPFLMPTGVKRGLSPFLVLAMQLAVLAQGPLPAPETVLGFAPGADYKLATYDQVVDYLKKVDAASDRVTLLEAGKSTQGRTFYFALVSSKNNLARIDRYREIARRLAHPESLTPADAERLVKEGKPFVHIDGGLHSTEVAGPQHTPHLLHEILSNAHTPEMSAILDNVVLMLWPTINPDGHQMVAEWYMKNAGASASTLSFPGLYQEYVGHDNNRDAYMLNMIESRVMEHTWREWEPQIIYVHHQSAPYPTRIWLPPFAEPIAAHAPYLMSREINMIGMAIAMELEERGQVGATHMGTGYDAWYPGYIDYLPVFKNIAAFWTETAGGLAPRESSLNDFPLSMRDLRPRSLYASPWPPGIWRMRDQIAYMTTASLAVLEFASKYRESILRNRYKAGRDQIARGRAAPPYAYFVPREQRDPVAAVELLRRLAFSGIRISELTSTVQAGEETVPAGAWVIPADQEFAALVRQVLDVQRYPDLREFPNGPLEQPYDAAGWTLPLAMGVRVIAASAPIAEDVRRTWRSLASPLAFSSKPTPYLSASMVDASPFDSVPGLGFDGSRSAAAILPRAGRVSGSGPVLALDPAQNNTFRAVNRALSAGLDVQTGEHSGELRYLVPGLSEQDQDQLATSLSLSAERTSAAGRALQRPRLALFAPPASMDAGWTRWILERYGFSFTLLSTADIADGALANVDVLIVADEPRGTSASPPNAVAALHSLDTFVRTGGTLVCLNRSSSFAIEQLKLPVKNVVAGLGRQEFFTGGSLLQVRANPTHRVMAGMPSEAAVFVQSSPAFETQEGFRGAVLARYAETGSPLLSGYLVGEKYLQGMSAALDIEHGSGHVVLIGFRPQWRGQTFGTFRVLFNAALYAHPDRPTIAQPSR